MARHRTPPRGAFSRELNLLLTVCAEASRACVRLFCRSLSFSLRWLRRQTPRASISQSPRATPPLAPGSAPMTGFASPGISPPRMPANCARPRRRASGRCPASASAPPKRCVNLLLTIFHRRSHRPARRQLTHQQLNSMPPWRQTMRKTMASYLGALPRKALQFGRVLVCATELTVRFVYRRRLSWRRNSGSRAGNVTSALCETG